MQKFVMVKKKNIIPNQVYHIVQRAPGDELLFKDAHDRYTILFIIKKLLPEYNIHLISYSLMPNHIHMQLKIHGVNLSQCMKKIFEQYAFYFNRKYSRKGHVFYGVYRLIHCCTPFSVIAVSLYIHLNASKARLVNDPLEYKWHSLKLFLSNSDKKFIYPDYVLSLINEDKLKAKKIYEKYLYKTMELNYQNVLLNKKAVREFINDSEKWSDHILI